MRILELLNEAQTAREIRHLVSYLMNIGEKEMPVDTFLQYANDMGISLTREELENGESSEYGTVSNGVITFDIEEEEPADMTDTEEMPDLDDELSDTEEPDMDSEEMPDIEDEMEDGMDDEMQVDMMADRAKFKQRGEKNKVDSMSKRAAKRMD
jgi:hypothetical protein